MLVRCIPLLRRLLPGALLLASLSLAPTPLLAQAQGDVFTVERVPVDVTATNAAVARDQGIAQAQQDGFARLFDRLTLDEDRPTPPPLGQAEIEQLVDSFEVVSERTSPVRYVAEINVTFRPGAVRSLMLSNGIRYAEVKSKPVLVLPVDETGPEPVLWQQETAWRQAWENYTNPPGLLPVLVPYGELQDVTDIDAAEALAGNEEAMRRIADRYGAGAVAVARLGLDGELQPPPTAQDPLAPADPNRFLASPGAATLPSQAPVGTAPPADRGVDDGRPRGLMSIVSVHRFDGAPEILTVDLPPQPDGTGTAATEPSAGAVPDLPPGTAELIPAAVNRVSNLMEQNWIRANLLETGKESVLSVRVPLSTLDEWRQTRSRLEQVATVTRTRLVELTRDRADLDLYYLGDANRLRTALAQRDLMLSEPAAPAFGGLPAPGQAGGERWNLQWRGAANAPVQPAGFGAPVPADPTGTGLDAGGRPPGTP